MSFRRPVLLLAVPFGLLLGVRSEAQETIRAIDGDTELGQLGTAVTIFGDADGDGVRDVAAGAPNVNYRDYGFGARAVPGEVVFFSAASGTLLFRTTLGIAGDELGRELLAVGDLNGDGIGDVLAAAPGVTLGNVGYVVALSGADGSVLSTIPGDLSGFGESLAALGDLDGDHVPDFAIGSPARNDPNATGTVYAYSGAANQLLYSVAGDSNSSTFGYALAAIADVDGDAMLDLAVGDQLDRTIGSEAGCVWLFSGAGHSQLQRFFPSGSLGRFGLSVCGTADADGDGIDDLLVGAPGAYGAAGAYHVVASVSGSDLLTVAGSAGDQLGYGLSRLEDVTGDGIPEISVGGYPITRPRHLFDGATNQLLQWFSVLEAGTEELESAGDVDGDGRPDLLHGVSDHSSATLRGCGRIELLSADDLYLYCDQRRLRGGAVVAFHARHGEPNRLIAPFLVSVDGVPTNLLLDVSLLDAAGAYDSAQLTVPASVGTHDFEVRAWSIASGRLVSSWAEVVHTD